MKANFIICSNKTQQALLQFTFKIIMTTLNYIQKLYVGNAEGCWLQWINKTNERVSPFPTIQHVFISMLQLRNCTGTELNRPI